jgi:MFS family permease
MTEPTVGDRPGWHRPALLGSVGTTAVILPAFLTGAVAVQLRDDLDLTESAIGLAIGAFFIGSSVGSAGLGRLAERLGPRSALGLGLAVTTAADLGVAGLARGAWSLAAILVVAGLANAIGQPAINLLVVRTVPRGRLGLVMALKQSGMPAAALLGGLAVPTIALTVGWRAAYLVGAAIAAGSGLLAVRIPAVDHPDRPPTRPSGPGVGLPSGSRTGRPDQGWPVLLVMAGVGVLGGGAANIVVGYLVSGAVAAGIAPGPAGLVLTGGSALGIASRLVHGWLADRGAIDALTRVIGLLTTGLLGALILSTHRPVAYLVAAPIVFAGGWAWPGLFNLVVVEANRSAPAAATGVTQTGVYVGSVLGPIVAGALIEASGYRAAWILTGACLGAAALATVAVRHLVGGVEQRPVPG